MTRFDKRIAVFGCKTTTQFICDFLMEKQQLHCLITIGPALATKNQVADYCDLREYAAAKGIELYLCQSYSLRELADQEYLRQLAIDVAFVVGWQRLLPAEVLAGMSIGAFGMHGSSLNLPKGRGRSPMNWSLLEGRKVFYTNLFKYDAGVDSGDVVDTFKFSITDRDTAETMHFKNTLAMKFLINKNLESIANNSFALTKQPDYQPTYYPKRSPADSLIDWTDDVYNIERFIRAVAPPFGGAFTFIGEERVVVLAAQVFDVVDFGHEAAAIATVVEVLAAGKFLVKGFGGLLLVTAYDAARNVRQYDIFGNGNLSIRSFPLNAQRGFDTVTEA